MFKLKKILAIQNKHNEPINFDNAQNLELKNITKTQRYVNYLDGDLALHLGFESFSHRLTEPIRNIISTHIKY